MRHSRSTDWHAPETWQLERAAELGVTVPEGISRRGLSLLITKARETVAREKIRYTLETMGLEPGTRLRRKSDDNRYRVTGINLFRREVNVYNETRRCGATLGLLNLTEFYEVIE